MNLTINYKTLPKDSKLIYIKNDYIFILQNNKLFTLTLANKILPSSKIDFFIKSIYLLKNEYLFVQSQTNWFYKKLNEISFTKLEYKKIFFSDDKMFILKNTKLFYYKVSVKKEIFVCELFFFFKDLFCLKGKLFFLTNSSEKEDCSKIYSCNWNDKKVKLEEYLSNIGINSFINNDYCLLVCKTNKNIIIDDLKNNINVFNTPSQSKVLLTDKLILYFTDKVIIHDRLTNQILKKLNLKVNFTYFYKDTLFLLSEILYLIKFN
ncbi:hypothetical protein TUBRATIS_21810 [Tubulinosema ratisbonensis]|uniref:Uncharacterized protein n=1 Tax=Tubulinosema ratisbonensis TaxID=291195 RepID=A0A437AJQ5_9MICR|nr:hypothetical protein TUBRATIS_21810 [Tubulinosema ratisbonensis]